MRSGLSKELVNPLEAFVRDIQDVKFSGPVGINTGNLLDMNHPQLLDALRYARNQRSEVWVLSGPALMTDWGDKSDLMEAFQQGLINRLVVHSTFGFEPYAHFIRTPAGWNFFQGGLEEPFSKPLSERINHNSWVIAQEKPGNSLREWAESEHTFFINQTLEAQREMNKRGRQYGMLYLGNPWEIGKLEEVAEEQMPPFGMVFADVPALRSLPGAHGLLFRAVVPLGEPPAWVLKGTRDWVLKQNMPPLQKASS